MGTKEGNLGGKCLQQTQSQKSLCIARVSVIINYFGLNCSAANIEYKFFPTCNFYCVGEMDYFKEASLDVIN